MTCEVCGKEYEEADIHVKVKIDGKEQIVNSVHAYGRRYNLCNQCLRAFITGAATDGRISVIS